MYLSLAKSLFTKKPKHKGPIRALDIDTDFCWYDYQSMAHGSNLFFKVIFPFL